MLTDTKRRFIEFMLSAEVLRFGSFTLKSGRVSPYFVNTGNYRTGAHIAALGGFYAAVVRQEAGDFDALFGPAYKGIPLVTACAAALAQQGVDKPYFFNRKEAKDHGEGGALVGYQPQEGDRIVLIEDVITAGTAVREVLPLLDSCRVQDMVISVDRCEIGKEGTKSAVQEVRDTFGLRVHSIVDVYDLLAYLEETNAGEQTLAAMKTYMAQYCCAR